MHEKLYKETKEAFEKLTETFAEKEQAILVDDTLSTIQSIYNLYEIEPYYAEIANEVIPEDAKLVIESDEDFDPAVDDLYEYKINLEDRKVYLKREYFGENIFYSTLYEYTDTYHKSISVYQNEGKMSPVSLKCLYFEEEQPSLFIQCTEYATLLKTYTFDGELISGYKQEWPGEDSHCVGELSYDPDGHLSRITEATSEGSVRVVYEADARTKDIQLVLEELEDFLVENIADQILEKVRIEEPVYCLLFEYTIQGPFPPTLAIGLASELQGRFEDQEPYELYNAPDMQYFSEHDEPNPLAIDFYPLDIQSEYLAATAYGEGISWRDEEAAEAWAQQVKEVYLRVCKRLMHFDFSTSFVRTENFLVMARDFEQCNEEEFFEALQHYKKEKGL
jgi:hypothetical protein